MAELGKKSLNMAKSLGGAIGRGVDFISGKKQSPEKLLGQIYKMMLKVQEEQDIDHELAMRDEKKKEKDEAERNAALIKALTARKKPKIRKPRKKKEEVKKEEKPKEKPAEKKTEEKKTEQKNKQDDAAKEKADKEAKDKADKEAKAAKDKADKEAKDKADKEAKAAKDKADREVKAAKEKAEKEAEKAKKTAEKEQAEAKKKAEEEEARKKETAEPVKPPEAKPPKAEPATKPPEVKPPPSAARLPPIGASAGKAALISALAEAGYSQSAQANVLANVKEESNFVPKSENIARYNATNLFKLFGPSGEEFIGRHGTNKGKKLIANPKNEKGKSNTVRFATIEDAEKLVSQGPEAVAELIYGGRMGNKNPGDGFKYIGRGYVQLTGRENYEKVGKLIGVDLVGNPELANDPKIAAKIVPAFFKVNGRKPKDLEDIDKAIDAVGSASAESRKERKKIAEEYNTKGFGDDLNNKSKENDELNENLKKQQQQASVTNVDASTTQQPSEPTKVAKVDDRSAMQKKMQG